MFDRKEYEGKRALRRWPKWLTALMAVVLVAAMTVGGTLAWLSAHTDALTNTFVMGVIVPNVDEEFPEQTTKSNVKITNTSQSNIPAFIRVALVPTWQTNEENSVPVGEKASLADLNITWGTTHGENGGEWVTDGQYYYYTVPVPAGKSTANLIDQATVKTQNGYRMNLQILVDAIQPTENAVENAWKGVEVTEGADGSLSITTPSQRLVNSN